jgi:hypothetical protein
MADTKLSQFRRKVVSASRDRTLGPWFTCTLSCGHLQDAYEVKPRGKLMGEAPKTSACQTCFNVATKETP